jgi:cytochrome c553
MRFAQPAGVQRRLVYASSDQAQSAFQGDHVLDRLDGRDPHRVGLHTVVSLKPSRRKPVKKMIFAVLSLALVALGARAEVDKKAEKNWKAKCASCHGADGKAETDMGKKAGIPNYADSAFQKSKTDDQLKSAIANGVKTDKGEMEGYKEKLSGEEIDNLVKLVRSFGK